MTIRRRVTLSFLLVLVLTGLNLVVFFWSSFRRQETVEGLRRASARQLVIASIREDLNDVQKQVTLLSQILPEAEPGTTNADGLTRFSARLDDIGRAIEELRGLAAPDERARVEAFGSAYRELAASWRVYYEHLGVNQSKAITELVVRAEPSASGSWGNSCRSCCARNAGCGSCRREFLQRRPPDGAHHHRHLRPVGAGRRGGGVPLVAQHGRPASPARRRGRAHRQRQLRARNRDRRPGRARRARAGVQRDAESSARRADAADARQRGARTPHEELRAARDVAESANRAKSGFLPT